MNTSALILMVITQVTVTLVTFYFFLKVLRTPHQKDDEDTPGTEDHAS